VHDVLTNKNQSAEKKIQKAGHSNLALGARAEKR
jgi:hypothetical protein